MSLTPAQMVREFHQTYHCAIADTPTPGTRALRQLRYDLIAEEVGELAAAMRLHADLAGRQPDLVGIADALADIAYVVYGTAISLGIDLDEVIAEVHRSNMSKLGSDGHPIYREDGKVLKGPSYSPPDIAAVLTAQALR